MHKAASAAFFRGKNIKAPTLKKSKSFTFLDILC